MVLKCEKHLKKTTNILRTTEKNIFYQAVYSSQLQPEHRLVKTDNKGPSSLRN